MKHVRRMYIGAGLMIVGAGSFALFGITMLALAERDVGGSLIGLGFSPAIFTAAYCLGCLIEKID